MNKFLFLIWMPTTLMAQWQTVYSSENEIYTFDYFESSLAVLKLDSVILSQDGGETWSDYLLPDSIVLAYDLVIYNKSNILVTGASPKLMVTNDQGLNWNVYNPLVGIGEYITSMCRLEGIGIAGVTNFSSFIIIDTLGNVVHYYPDISTFPLYDIEVYGQDSIILLGNEGIYYSINMGASWSIYPLGVSQSIGFDTYGGASITTGGDVYLSQDCGVNWYPFNYYYETEISTYVELLKPFSDYFMIYEDVSFSDATYLFSRLNDSGQLVYYPGPLYVVELDCGDDQTCFSLSIDNTQAHMDIHRVDIEELVNSWYSKPDPLIFHPNPTSTSLSITSLEAYQIDNITTFSIDGRIVDLPFQNGQADVSHVAPGIYITTVQTEQGKWQEKWVKL